MLVVDDDPDDRALAARALKSELDGAEIVEIGDESSLSDALRELAAPALAVTDHALGWTDGFTVFARIKAAYPDCPVVMFTGVGDEEVAVAAMKAGFADYLIKTRLKRLGTAARAVMERASGRSVGCLRAG